ncbi:hypothetical protein CLAFUW4_09471 [Fulvia fulva]|uniref:Uncharacterized protein n=1 Tax=Passalora fulva TaxID=5499 RepID=A0A9Q8PFB1_PASFU|nr:uncharacterized protein CLAFUR5_09568 [Fulvia fulva]KAK4614074.1 hypothetical protein CLAFUR4_09477 [Fulvia fulva]KAK4614737.1 hypothetical protein CLAFUR0_09468 [Fulvia fulva]UJO21441.1 hypothetical protein CLAFUR5_09568 [Fulvia fulva]WPV20011.1 hypothetical protein CLAFUW4_09471 [Fulvia fulva]WPV35132.1 hypothetical protein CLAFUW7_09472 [Fulvia fulva]
MPIPFLPPELWDHILDYRLSTIRPPPGPEPHTSHRTILITRQYRFPHDLHIRNHIRHDFAAYYYGTTTFHFVERDLIRPFLEAVPSEHRRMIHSIRFSYNASGRSYFHVELQVMPRLLPTSLETISLTYLVFQVMMLRRLLGEAISRDLRDRQFEVGSVVPGYGDHFWERGHGFGSRL